MYRLRQIIFYTLNSETLAPLPNAAGVQTSRIGGAVQRVFHKPSPGVSKTSVQLI